MKHGTLFAIAFVVIGCGTPPSEFGKIVYDNNPTVTSMDAGTSPDLVRKSDLATAPDLIVVPDLSQVPDMATPPDMVSAPDLVVSVDLAPDEICVPIMYLDANSKKGIIIPLYPSFAFEIMSIVIEVHPQCAIEILNLGFLVQFSDVKASGWSPSELLIADATLMGPVLSAAGAGGPGYRSRIITNPLVINGGIPHKLALIAGVYKAPYPAQPGDGIVGSTSVELIWRNVGEQMQHKTKKNLPVKGNPLVF